MKIDTFYVTTAIPYVNAAPHVGFALELIQADCIARYRRLLNYDVHFLTGTDENALKNYQAAEKEGIPVRKLVDKYAQKYLDLADALNASNDDFIRTTNKRHFDGAQALWQACYPDDLYKKSYRGSYCIGCEMFITEKELVDGKCPEHHTEPTVVEEENYFFRLSRYQDQLRELIASDRIKIIPDTRKNEVLRFIDQGLEDISVSRSAERVHHWGVPVPGDPDQIMYVWFDALGNYITALDFIDRTGLYKKYWPADVHVIGKGIIRFHAIYWPAFLLSADIELPKTIFVHGYITLNGKKISKTLGNVIDPIKLVEKYGTDSLRYYLLAKIPATGDGNFTRKHFEEVYTGELANGLGNLVQRIAVLCDKSGLQFDGRIPQLKDVLDDDTRTAMDSYRFHDAAALIWNKLRKLDQYIDREEPWKLLDADIDRLGPILDYLVTEIRAVSVLLTPFMPETAQKIQEQFSQARIKPDEILFPRLEESAHTRGS